MRRKLRKKKVLEDAEPNHESSDAADYEVSDDEATITSSEGEAAEFSPDEGEDGEGQETAAAADKPTAETATTTSVTSSSASATTSTVAAQAAAQQEVQPAPLVSVTSASSASSPPPVGPLRGSPVHSERSSTESVGECVAHTSAFVSLPLCPPSPERIPPPALQCCVWGQTLWEISLPVPFILFYFFLGVYASVEVGRRLLSD